MKKLSDLEKGKIAGIFHQAENLKGVWIMIKDMYAVKQPNNLNSIGWDIDKAIEYIENNL